MSSKAKLPGLRARCWLSVVQAYQTCHRQYARMLAAFDLTVPQFELLCVVEEANGSATPAQIADRLRVTRGNVSPILRRVLERGWVSEVAHPSDRRSVQLRLTASGRRLLGRARSASAVFIETQLAPFDDSEVARTLDQMLSMRAHLEAMDIDAVLRRARTTRRS